MELKQYNSLQVKLFKKYNLFGKPDFFQACQIIAKYRECNNTLYFAKAVITELKRADII
jgi:hypothetical protein